MCGVFTDISIQLKSYNIQAIPEETGMPPTKIFLYYLIRPGLSVMKALQLFAFFSCVPPT
jgi:hypothetical protein